jgi:transcriptional regulator with XRE-family HTH domain
MAKHPIAIQLGRALRARRRAAGIGQDQFADLIDMQRAYYSAVERGEKKVTLKTLKRLADGFGVTISQILQEVGR